MSVEKIPVQNIYFLLCYAWNHLQEAKYAQVRSEGCDKIWDLLAKALLRSSQQLVKRGLHRNYVIRRERRVRPKGKVLLTEDIRKPFLSSPNKVCEFDELSANILPNQIIKSTFLLLLRNDSLNKEIRKELYKNMPYWEGFKDLSVRPRHFRRLQIHRNMRHYRFTLSICELIHKAYLPNVEEGQSQFRDFVRDEAMMGSLFEQFVRNFYSKEQLEYAVSASQVKWAMDPDKSTEGGLRLLPTMQTDIFLESPEDKLIIDCKFYKEAFQQVHNTQKIHSQHLYQLYAYVTNQAIVPGWENGKGMLLYPSAGQSFDESVSISGHSFRVASINLNQDWNGIAEDLLTLLTG